jgi:bacteriocin biosynthesis cyclodehydratase domain-containing protein
MNGKPLRKIIDELAPMRIGIIGTNQLVNCLLKDLINGGLLYNFNIVITDTTSELNKINENSTVNITNYANPSDPLYLNSFVDKSDFIIACSNYSDHHLFRQVNELCIKLNKRWLRIMIDGDYSEIGPIFIPNKTCCYSCLRTREIFNMSENEYIFDNLHEDSKLHEDLREKSVGLYSIYYINSMSSAIACSEVMKLLTGLKCNLLNQVMRVNFFDFVVQTDTIFRYHLCSTCSERL